MKIKYLKIFSSKYINYILSRLLHAVALGSLSQYPSGGYNSHCPYPSKVW